MFEERIKRIIREALRNVLNEEMVLHHKAKPHTELQNFTPKKTFTGYKQFKLRLDKNGRNMANGYVFPLYVNTEETLDGNISKGLKIGVWYKAGEGECYLDTKNNRLYTIGKGYDVNDGNRIDKLAYRPGWHLTNTPWGNQRGDGKLTNGMPGTGNNYLNTRNNEVWAKVEICAEKDMSDVAWNSDDHYLQHLGDNEFYSYKTNSNASKDQSWWIVDKIKIVEILSDDDVDSINDKFYNELSSETGRRIHGDPNTYIKTDNKSKNQSATRKYNEKTKRNDLVIPYWKMPRKNGIRYSKEDLLNMGY